MARAQDAAKESMRHHKEAVEEKMQPVVTLIKVLQITDDRAFVGTYQQLLQQKYQNAEAMQQLLNLLDLSKESAAARLAVFRGPGGSSGLLAAVRLQRAVRCCHSLACSVTRMATPETRSCVCVCAEVYHARRRLAGSANGAVYDGGCCKCADPLCTRFAG